MKSFTLRNIPKDIMDYLLDKQVELKKSKGKQYGMEPTLYAIIRDCKRCEEKEDKAA